MPARQEDDGHRPLVAALTRPHVAQAGVLLLQHVVSLPQRVVVTHRRRHPDAVWTDGNMVKPYLNASKSRSRKRWPTFVASLMLITGSVVEIVQR